MPNTSATISSSNGAQASNSSLVSVGLSPPPFLAVGQQPVVQRGIACAQAFEVEPVEAFESRLRAQFREGKAVVQSRRGTQGRSGLDMNGLCV